MSYIRYRDSLIADLQQQVNDLTLALEEERLNHKQTKDKAAEILRGNLEKFLEEKSEDMKEISYNHQKERDQMKEDYDIKLRNLRRTMDETKNKLTAEIEFLNGAFESYKSQLSNDLYYKSEKKENELKSRLIKEKEEQIDELKTKLYNEKAVEKADLIQKHKKETLQIRKEHKRELEALTRKYSNAAEDKQLLRSTEEDLSQLKDELLISKENHNSVCKQLAEITDELAKTKFELLGYEKNFAEKVGVVDDQYRKKVEQLIEENVELRKRYADKCAKLSEERMSVEKLEKEKLKYAKENMRLKIEHQKQLELALSSEKQEKSKVEEEDDDAYSGFAKYAVFP
ncbi:DgyrCDS7717 [Dimorphilus gyrociliatus]|uniref:DgyrCDS7717 n=1 Tax=Dimorphilus gyrociliatus TaxID=2664684 RepID=A0A7I8VUG8_9ANNE|nr:DgyrCDS7717 [Dimorphilus gyrociliatus]